MAQSSFVQATEEQETSAQILESGVFLATSQTVQIGVLGGSETYHMPKLVLSALAQHLFGEISTDFPPFLVACTDGLVLVLTLHTDQDFIGVALCLLREKLLSMDKGIVELWQRSEKDQTIEDFFRNTMFKTMNPTIPSSVELPWKSAFC